VTTSLAAVYLMLLLFLQVDGYLFPGNESVLPAVPVFVPGTQLGVDIALAGVSSGGTQPWKADPRLRDEAPAIRLEYPPGQDALAKQARAHLVAYGVPPVPITLRAGAAGADPAIFDLTGKKYTAGKMVGLFDLRLKAFDGEAPPGIDIIIRMGETTATKAP